MSLGRRWSGRFGVTGGCDHTGKSKWNFTIKIITTPSPAHSRTVCRPTVIRKIILSDGRPLRAT